MRTVLLVAFAATMLAACAELPSTEESTTLAAVDDVTAVQSTEVPSPAKIEKAAEVAANDAAMHTGASIPSKPIGQELLELVGAESPEEVYQSLEKQQRLMLIMTDRTFPEDAHIMREIARCESPNRSFRHWEANGELVPNDEGASSARGAFQVLVRLHAPDIERLQHINDMHNVEHYMAFVRYLYERAGRRNWSKRFSDWEESRSCWETRLASR